MKQIIGTGDGTNAVLGAPAFHMLINAPRKMAVDASGSLLIAAKDRIRVVAPQIDDDDASFHYGRGNVLDLMQNGGFPVGSSTSLELDEQCLAAHDIQCLSGVSVFYEDNREKVMAFDSCQAVAFVVEPAF
ncbi:MAG: hypothetical protein GY822_06300 [Deltaproteobacteria bacterium]|nr:hypothetical protein [Deltaproteobacteria bacterium]